MIEISEVRQYIENWIKTFVSIPTPKREGLAPCPYSKETLLRNRIDIRCFNSPDLLDIVMELTKTWTDDFEIVLLATVPESIEPHTIAIFEF